MRRFRAKARSYTRPMRFVVVGVLGVVLLAAAWGLVEGVSQAGAGTAAPRCTQLGGWQRLANKIKAPVYCPSWLPDPLVPQIGNRWNNIDSVDKDGSYLESWAWQEAAGLNTQEIHVILRGYPGQTAIPRTCQDVTTVNGKTYRKKIAVLPGSARHVALGERDHGDDVHRQPRRRLLACPLRLAPRGLALHPQRARGAAALVLEGRRQPEAHARRARARPTDVHLMSLTRRQALVGGAERGRRGGRHLRARRPAHRHAGPRRGAVVAAARAAPAERRPGRHRQRRRGARAAAPSRGRDGEGRRRRPRQGARRDLEDALAELESRYPATPAGLGVTVAWGLPYFRRHVPAQWERLQPYDIRAQSAALLDARRFPSDPEETELEAERRRRSCFAATASTRSRLPRRRCSTTSAC